MQTQRKLRRRSLIPALALLFIVPGVLWLGGGMHSLAAPVFAEESQPAGALLSPRAPAAISGSTPWAWILCKFADKAEEPHAVSYYTTLRDDLNTYLKEVSYNKANIDGSSVHGWYTLPYTWSHYDVYTTAGLQAIATDCTAQALADGVNFTAIYGINVTINGSLGAVTYWPTLNLTGVARQWPTTFVSDYSGGIYSMGLVAHEMYHGFGLSHSAVRDGSGAAIGGNEWDPVGKGACGFGTCIPVHLPSVQKDILGWVDAAKTLTVASHGVYTITLEQLAQPQTENYLMVKIPQGTNHYYTVEARRKVGYDGPITSAAVIIHERLPFVNNGYIEVLSPPDQEHPEFPQWPDKRWLVGDVFQNATKSVKVTVLAETATGFRIQLETQGVKIYLPLLIR